MKKLRIAFSAVVLASWPLVLAAEPPDLFGERVDVNVVNVDVYVSDKDGKPVTDLGRGDFEIREDGKPIAIVNFEAFARPTGAGPEAPQPAAPSPTAPATRPSGEVASLVVYVDNTFLLPTHRNRVLQQLRDTLSQLRPEDRVMLVTQDPGLHIRLPFTTDRSVVSRALDEIEHLGASGIDQLSSRREAMRQILMIHEVAEKSPDSIPCPLEIGTPAQSYAAASRSEVLRTLHSLTLLVNSLSGVPGRKALLLVSDSLPATPGEEVFQVLVELCGNGGALGLAEYNGRQAALDAQRYSTVTELAALAAHANAQQVTMYTLQAGGLQGNLAAAAEFGPDERTLQLQSIGLVQSANEQGGLNALASDTGGRAILNANDVRPDMARLRQDLGLYYSLGISPPHTGDGRSHSLEVRVKRPGLHVRYRKGYRDKPALERVVDRTLASAFYGQEDNPLEVRMEIGEMAPAGKAGWLVPVRLHIPLFKLAIQPGEQFFTGKVLLLVATHGTDGRGSPVRQVKVPIQIPHDKALIALGQYYLYEVKLTLEPGEQRIAVAVRDEASTTTSYLARSVRVGAAEGTGKPASPAR